MLVYTLNTSEDEEPCVCECRSLSVARVFREADEGMGTAMGMSTGMGTGMGTGPGAAAAAAPRRRLKVTKVSEARSGGADWRSAPRHVTGSQWGGGTGRAGSGGAGAAGAR